MTDSLIRHEHFGKLLGLIFPLFPSQEHKKRFWLMKLGSWWFVMGQASNELVKPQQPSSEEPESVYMYLRQKLLLRDLHKFCNMMGCLSTVNWFQC